MEIPAPLHVCKKGIFEEMADPSETAALLSLFSVLGSWALWEPTCSFGPVALSGESETS